jgi:aminoglycoside phosphotransferase (APT) family kinase protein
MTAADLARPDLVGPLLAAVSGDDRWTESRAILIAGGKSNLTFEIRCAAGSAILRRPPTGRLLPGAHNMVREARVQRLLAGTGVPVPRILLDHPESDLLGVPFYVMERVEGVVVRDSLPQRFAPHEADRSAMTDALVDALVALHEVDPTAQGLADFGRTGGFALRQVATWRKQYEASTTEALESVNELAGLLDRHPWSEPSRASVVHGDYRFDNCVFDAADPRRIAALLDWELSTLGDPLTDLGLLLAYWVEPEDEPPALTPAVTREGFPRRAEVAERYAVRSGRDLADLAAYVALAQFKLACIVQGVATRSANGQMGGQEFGDLDHEVDRIASNGLRALTGHLL